eukprot:TRINITY_DN6935_c0_g1_i3.p2 TRINITY_DN6935_c0_g1~~TRINITY_DN6935_c0_g1_i3.p2  ORF type:complete len:115 (+),score=50.91 TRINITY_DN6935_c0_g1_i3:113-457(+)
MGVEVKEEKKLVRVMEERLKLVSEEFEEVKRQKEKEEMLVRGLKSERELILKELEEKKAKRSEDEGLPRKEERAVRVSGDTKGSLIPSLFVFLAGLVLGVAMGDLGLDLLPNLF